jgi:hypothetical protein
LKDRPGIKRQQQTKVPKLKPLPEADAVGDPPTQGPTEGIISNVFVPRVLELQRSSDSEYGGIL